MGIDVKMMLDASRQFPLTYFLSGVVFVCFAASSLFFFKFWRKTRDPFFLTFALACLSLAVERIALLYLGHGGEIRAGVYFFRLIAFLLILISLYHANRKNSSR